MEKDRDMGQAKGWAVCCCKCYWNDQCCSGCGVEQEDCDDFTPLFKDSTEELDYIEQEYLNDLNDSQEEYEEDMCEWSDCITSVFLQGEDISDDNWWTDVERKY